jgi:hypothetical protein
VPWECNYYVVLIPTSPQKLIYRKLRASIGRILPDFRKQKGMGLSVARRVGVRPYGNVDVGVGQRIGVGVWGPHGGVRVGRVFVGW